MEAPASRPDPQTANQPEPYNPYHSLPGARLTNETVAEFLQRLPPAQAEFTIPAHLRPPWYWIANPNRSAYLGGRADTGDVASFTREGQALLAEFRANVAQCARNAPIRTQLREVLKGEIAALAKRCGVTVGKVRSVVFPSLFLTPHASFFLNFTSFLLLLFFSPSLSSCSSCHVPISLALPLPVLPLPFEIFFAQETGR
jgi:hypothetical protein